MVGEVTDGATAGEATAATVTRAMAAAADAVAMETVATAAMAAMAGKMTAVTERDRLTPSPTARKPGERPPAPWSNNGRTT